MAIPITRSLERSIQPAATRFADRALVPSKPLLEAWDHDDDASSASDASTDLDDDSFLDDNLELAKRQAKRRKARELETLVQMTPLLTPGASPIVTWGNVTGTPRVTAKEQAASKINTENSSIPDHIEVASFHLPPTSDKERAAALAEAKIAQRVRLSKETPRRSAPQLSAAAQQLLRSKTSRHAPSSRSACSFGSALRSSYATSSARASGRRRSKSKSSAMTDTAYRATPLPSKRIS